jgi:glycosyltransferase involved in cell wall biosynthesis
VTRRKILLVTIHAGSMPGSGGNVRSHFFIRTACALGDVTLVSLCSATGQTVDPQIRSLCTAVFGGVGNGERTPPRQPSGRFAALWNLLIVLLMPWRRQWCDFVAYCVQHCGSNEHGGRKRLLSAILSREYWLLNRMGFLPPLLCAAYWNTFQQIKQQMLDLVRDDEHGAQFDCLWVEDVYAYPFARHLERSLGVKIPLSICNTYNMEWSVFQRLAESAATPGLKSHLLSQSRAMLRMEKVAYSQSDLTFVCSTEDAVVGKSIAADGEFRVVGNGVDLQYFAAAGQATDAEAPLLLLTGTFGYGPNRQATEFFAKQVLPLIRRTLPGVRFLIAGGQARTAWAQLGLAACGVEFDSDPADIRPAFRQATVFVVPLLSGGGTRLKILEAMAMGVPIVSTTIGAEGLGCRSDEQLLLADGAEAFAAAVVRMLQQPSLQKALCQNAAEWIKTRYDWKLLCAQATGEVERLLER